MSLLYKPSLWTRHPVTGAMVRQNPGVAVDLKGTAKIRSQINGFGK